MVFYFISDVVDPPVTLMVGEDKNENEELIKYVCMIVYYRMCNKCSFI